MEGFRGAVAQLALGNSYSTTPQIELKLVLAKQRESIQVTGYVAVSTQMPGGQVRQEDMSTSDRWVRDVQGMLSEIDAAYRASIPAASVFPKGSIGILFDAVPSGALLVEVVLWLAGQFCRFAEGRRNCASKRDSACIDEFQRDSAAARSGG
jgi:hypothetical protein